MKRMLELNDVCVSVNGKRIIKGISLVIGSGEVHVLMGPNGSGKSTLAHAIMGFPGHSVKGSIILDGEDISRKKVDERARKGLFLSFQSPPEIPGVKNSTFVRQAHLARGSTQGGEEFTKEYEKLLVKAGLGPEFGRREVNVGFSGGERKKNELVQMLSLRPKAAIIDEIDSGLDIDSVKKAAASITSLAKAGTAILLITHSPRITHYLGIKPSRVYVLQFGCIVRQGGHSLIEEIEENGFGDVPVGGSEKGAAK